MNSLARLAFMVIKTGVVSLFFGLLVLLAVVCGVCVGLVVRLFTLPGRLIERGASWFRS